MEVIIHFRALTEFYESLSVSGVYSVYRAQGCVPAHKQTLPVTLLAGQLKQLGCGARGSLWGETVCFFLPAVWTHRLQTGFRSGG